MGGAGFAGTGGAGFGVTCGAGFGLTGGAGTWEKETLASCININADAIAQMPSVAGRKSLLFMCPIDFESSLLFGLLTWRVVVWTEICGQGYNSLRGQLIVRKHLNSGKVRQWEN